MYKRSESYLQPSQNYPVGLNPINPPPQHHIPYDNNPPPLPMYYDNAPPGQIGQIGPIEPYLPPQDMQYEQRYYQPAQNWRDIPQQATKAPSLPPPAENYPMPTVLQRLSMMIKSQLPALQPIMRQIANHQMEGRRQRSKSRSRSRSRDHSFKRNSSLKEPMQWLCRKCSFSNFDWRDKCKRCGETHHPKGFVPGPEDWRCPKCNNINYARRSECNRCKTVKDK